MGIDIGTTFTAAAVSENGRAATITLGDHQASVPSVLLLNSDDTFLVGDTAVRRGVSEPERVAREFKRRIGDSQQILVGGVPYSAEMLTSRLLRWVVDQVQQRQGAEPDNIVLAHPANWGSFKTDLPGQAAQMAGLANKVSLVTEPEAAAISYAADQRLESSQLIAVYDRGGGTFDSALLRKTDVGFATIGDPIGIERLGGIDFDAAVFGHVSRALDGELERLDPDDDDVVVSVARLKAECTLARESLSVDTAVAIPVLLPGLSERVRLTRTELESMLRPIVAETVAATRQGMEAAGVEPSDLAGVLLVGGCSRTPFVAQALIAEFGRPILLGLEPTFAVALGAAHQAELIGSTQPTTPVTPPIPVTSPMTPSEPTAGLTPSVVSPQSSFAEPPVEPVSPQVIPLPDPASAAAVAAIPPGAAVPPVAAVAPDTSNPAVSAFLPSGPETKPRPNRLSASRIALVAVSCVGVLGLAALAYVIMTRDDPTLEASGDGSSDSAPEAAAGNVDDVVTEPVRATVDAGSVVAVEVTNPVIGTDEFQSALTPPEFVAKRTIGGEIQAFLDVAPTTNTQFYDFATFATASGNGSSLGTWSDVVPAEWLTNSPERPTSRASALGHKRVARVVRHRAVAGVLPDHRRELGKRWCALCR